MEIFIELPKIMYQHTVEDIEEKIKKLNNVLPDDDKITNFVIYHKKNNEEKIETWLCIELEINACVMWFTNYKEPIGCVNDFLIRDLENNYKYREWEKTICEVNL